MSGGPSKKSVEDVLAAFPYSPRVSYSDLELRAASGTPDGPHPSPWSTKSPGEILSDLSAVVDAQIAATSPPSAPKSGACPVCGETNFLDDAGRPLEHFRPCGLLCFGSLRRVVEYPPGDQDSSIPITAAVLTRRLADGTYPVRFVVDARRSVLDYCGHDRPGSACWR